MKITAFILVYNKEIVNSVTYNSIKDYENLDIVICDNSTMSNDNPSFCLDNGINYYSKNENLGISKAYNYIFEIMSNKTDYLMLLDDDTDISIEYLDDVFNTIKNDSEIDIVVPKVISKSDGLLYSPRYRINSRLKKDIHAINSGLVVSNRILCEFRYNENIFLYFADLDFFNKNQHRKIVVLKSKIIQDFSEQTSVVTDSTLRQLQMRLTDAKVYFKPFKYYIYIVALSVQQFIITRNLRVVKLILSNTYNSKK